MLMKTPTGDKLESDVTGRDELTQKMIDAGVLAYLSFDARFEGYDDVVIRIWRAMSQAQNS
jgi:hypothetical protein